MISGVSTHLIDSADLQKLEQELLQVSNDNDIKVVLNKYHKNDTSEFSLGPYLDKINKCFSGSTVEEIYSSLEKDGSKWAQDTIVLLNKMSPTSLKVSLKELEMGKSMNLHDCLKMEYRIAVRCVEGHDFREGNLTFLVRT